MMDQLIRSAMASSLWACARPPPPSFPPLWLSRWRAAPAPGVGRAGRDRGRGAAHRCAGDRHSDHPAPRERPHHRQPRRAAGVGDRRSSPRATPCQTRPDAPLRCETGADPGGFAGPRRLTPLRHERLVARGLACHLLSSVSAVAATSGRALPLPLLLSDRQARRRRNRAHNRRTRSRTPCRRSQMGVDLDAPTPSACRPQQLLRPCPGGGRTVDSGSLQERRRYARDEARMPDQHLD